MTAPLQSRYVFARDELDVLCDAAFAWLDGAEPGACVESFEGPTTYERESGSLEGDDERPRLNDAPCEVWDKQTYRRYKGLAVHFVRRSGVSFEDGVQAAMIGIVRALRRFDEDRGVSFSTYASYWIRHELGREQGNDRRAYGVSRARASPHKLSVTFWLARDSRPRNTLSMPANETRPAASTTTDSGTFRAWITGSESGVDEETGEGWSLFTMFMETPNGETFGYLSKPNRVRADFFARVW